MNHFSPPCHLPVRPFVGGPVKGKVKGQHWSPRHPNIPHHFSSSYGVYLIKIRSPVFLSVSLAASMRTPSFAHLSPRTIPPGLEELVPILQQPVEVVPVLWNNDDAWEDVLGGVAVVPPDHDSKHCWGDRWKRDPHFFQEQLSLNVLHWLLAKFLSITNCTWFIWYRLTLNISTFQVFVLLNVRYVNVIGLL